MNRLVVIGPSERRDAARVRTYAETHVYKPGPGVPSPGDDPHFVTHLWGLRVVFSITDFGGRRVRMLSVSVMDRPGVRPHPGIVQEIARLYGFTGTVIDWEITLIEGGVVMVEQPVPDEHGPS
jgi:hypothetical protein